MGPVVGADSGWLAMRAAWKSELALGFHSCPLYFLCVCPSCFWADVRGCPFRFQKVAGSDSRDDRKRGDSRSSGDADVIVLGLQILNADKHFSDGHHDDHLHAPSHLHLLPSMGWHVFRPFLQHKLV